MLVEISGNNLYFQTISRTGATVDKGVLRRITRKPSPTPRLPAPKPKPR